MKLSEELNLDHKTQAGGASRLGTSVPEQDYNP